MFKYIEKEDFPKVEMELFSKTYPCYLLLNVLVKNNSCYEIYNYETEYVNGEWLLKTRGLV